MSAHAVRRALSRIEESPWTRNWKHLDTVHKGAWLNKSRHQTSIPQPVRARDRIKQWNIVPGDRIRIRGETSGAIKEVFGINRFRNLVFLKTPQEEVNERERPVPPSVSYARCQLYIGDREFPPAPGETTPRVLPVFASRIGCTAPKYVVSLGKFDWERFALQTTPRLSGDHNEKVKIPIPWPKPEPPVIRPIGMYDTPEDVVKEITWQPSPLYYPPSTRVKNKLLQDAYLHSIRPPPSSLQALKYDPTTSAPIEYALSDELSNPHSSAKKQLRTRKRKIDLKDAHERFLEDELAILGDRNRKEALIEAEWKWRERLRKEDRERRKMRWVLRGGAARLKRRRQREARKDKREVEKLKNLTLQPGPNQVLPSTLPAA